MITTHQDRFQIDNSTLKQIFNMIIKPLFRNRVNSITRNILEVCYFAIKVEISFNLNTGLKSCVYCNIWLSKKRGASVESWFGISQ